MFAIGATALRGRLCQFFRMPRIAEMNSQVCEAKPSCNRRDPDRAEVIERVFQKIGDVSSLPSRAVEIMELARDSEADAEELIDVIRSDPAIAMRIMRTVNSSYHGLRQSVGDLKQAVMLLGFQEIRNIAMSAYVAPLFSESPGYGSYTREGLWNHMVSTGMVAQHIAKISGRVNPQEAYLAGLLHDIGFVMIDQYLHKPFRCIVDGLTPETPAYEVERETIGFDHAELGEYVTEQWQLPEHLTDAIGHHHHPGDYDGAHGDMVLTVTLSDWLCDFRQLPALGIATTTPPPAELFAELGLERSEVTAILSELDEALNRAKIMANCQRR
jgi:putative nucleotidyltransferase with HDIG domain